MKSIEQLIKEEAVRLGFSACGFSTIEPLTKETDRLDSWLSKGYHGSMTYMHNHRDLRINPTLLLEGAQSIISVILSYNPAQRQPSHLPQIAQYAYGKDYHYVIKQRLKELSFYIESLHPTSNQVAFTDSAPILERIWAVRGGLGWIGKNGLLIHPLFGSKVLIGELITTLPLLSDQPMKERCGTCSKCLEACPTNAFIAPYQLDARRCVSYLTIESREETPNSLINQMGNRLFGCDSCLDACPWNKKAPFTTCRDFDPLPGLFEIDWNEIGRGTFNRMFKSSPLSRAGLKKIQRRVNEINNPSYSAFE